MLLIGSLLLVLGTVGVVVLNLSPSEGELRFGFQQMIHARIPWLLLGALAAGCALGIASIVRGRRWYAYPIVGIEVVLSGLLAFSFLQLSWLPAHSLALEVGDPFPAYSLSDQDGRSRSAEAGSPALYIFYRGDW